MKKIILFFIIYLLSFASFDNLLNTELEKNSDVIIKKLLEEKNKGKELDVGFFSKNKNKISEKIITKLKEKLVLKNKDINILSENYEEVDEILKKENNDFYEDKRVVGILKKTKYVINIKINEYTIKNYFYLKKDEKINFDIEIIDLSSKKTIFNKNSNIEFNKKVKNYKIYLLSLFLFVFGLLISFITKKYYTIKIMSITVFLIIILNIYYLII
ncbi:hypothetical protein EV215_0792 [Hypnocyclicus thermotrophus]|uniref:Uncharacterized protein n=1 Tax=Hypnocyclicus thermotrophus TaxID=1627895 RepID=A0AA46DZ52_9FUSO|nr:hypothetical protein [Hypnocyclicus thermotrophus]TDT71419.1 hypothetical protein EV215_0792 [Hypnocyclicus thermotrophus]